MSLGRRRIRINENFGDQGKTCGKSVENLREKKRFRFALNRLVGILNEFGRDCVRRYTTGTGG